ncbi:MAG: hypothetical protein AB2693_29865 [Candidatus Thiodiazotropha sp.]
MYTVKILNFGTPKITVFCLKMEQFGLIYNAVIITLKDAAEMANSVDTDQTALLRAV